MEQLKKKKKVCENCEYWYAFSKPEIGRWGACHKYAPRYQNHYKFPEVTRQDWCGEFKKK